MSHPSIPCPPLLSSPLPCTVLACTPCIFLSVRPLRITAVYCVPTLSSSPHPPRTASTPCLFPLFAVARELERALYVRAATASTPGRRPKAGPHRAGLDPCRSVFRTGSVRSTRLVLRMRNSGQRTRLNLNGIHSQPPYPACTLSDTAKLPLS